MQNKDITKSSQTERNDYLSAFKDLENKMESMFHNMWRNPFRHEEPPVFSFPLMSNMPKMDVIDRDKEIFVKAELPGIDKKDLDVSITNDRLLIKAQTCHEEKEEKGDYLKQEISKSEVYRSVLLPAEIDDSKIKTSFKNGILELTIPKKKSAHRKRIEVK